MTSQKVTITAPNGMHARPAGELAKLVKGFAPVRITLEVCAEGGDEAAAVKAVAAFIANMSE